MNKIKFMSKSKLDRIKKLLESDYNLTSFLFKWDIKRVK